MSGRLVNRDQGLAPKLPINITAGLAADPTSQLAAWHNQTNKVVVLVSNRDNNKEEGLFTLVADLEVLVDLNNRANSKVIPKVRIRVNFTLISTVIRRGIGNS